ncbi:hypothetical protein L2E82_27301 [Cichorium intybus]|uniref:Uncharacterized protein n=1 Tax=Cichorium intybus TaxID=13427 RepID=A0ACB9CSK4_CICIN|nr:hypothetical protein L2E82_27301 [Cichorium intybus]
MQFVRFINVKFMKLKGRVVTTKGIKEHIGASEILSPLPFAARFSLLKRKGFHHRNIMSMNWAQRKIFLYNVTFGLYMLDPWERYLFNALVIVLMWFIFYNGYRNLNELCKRHLW